jgi:hypothetical protein
MVASIAISGEPGEQIGVILKNITSVIEGSGVRNYFRNLLWTWLSQLSHNLGIFLKLLPDIPVPVCLLHNVPKVSRLSIDLCFRCNIIFASWVSIS